MSRKSIIVICTLLLFTVGIQLYTLNKIGKIRADIVNFDTAILDRVDSLKSKIYELEIELEEIKGSMGIENKSK